MFVSQVVAFRLGSRLAIAAVLGLVLGSWSCTDPLERTQVWVVVDAEGSLRTRIRYVDVEVRSGRQHEEVWGLETQWRLMPRDESSWPRRFQLDSPQPGTGFHVTASAKGADDLPIAVVRAQSTYVEGRTLELVLRFDEACAARPTPCGDTFSCRDGSCVDPKVPVDTLVPPGSVADRESGGTTGSAGNPATTSPDPGCAGPGCAAPAGCSGADCTAPCPSRDARGVCRECPAGFVGSTADGCSPALTSLEPSAGALTPAFDPNQISYAIEVPLLTQSLALRFEAEASIEVLVNGEPLAARGEYSTSLALGEENVVFTLNAPGHPSRSYRLTVRRTGAQRAQLTAMNADAGDAFGAGLAVSGKRLLVGAPMEDGSRRDVADEGAMNSGAAYLFERADDGSWHERAYFKAEQPRAGARFGHSVAIDGDRLAIAAPEEGGQGAVYVFELQGDTWAQTAVLRESGAELLGRGLALRGDLLAAGDPADSVASPDGGCVYVFARGSEGWVREAVLRPERPGPAEWLGSSVVIEGNMLLSGATGRDDGSGIASGAVFVFEREAGGWRERQVLVPEPAELGMFFGSSLAVTGDLVAAGGFFGSVGLTGGAAYVYRRGADGVYSQEIMLRPTNSRSGDFFGAALVFAHETLAVGAPRESSAAPGVATPATGMLDKSGAIYLFERDRGAWRQVVEIKPDAPMSAEEFGRNVVVSGDEMMVAAPNDLESRGMGARSGAVYTFR